MYQRIMVPIDGSDSAWKALAYAQTLGEKFQSELLVLHVVQPYYSTPILATPMDTPFIPIQPQDVERSGQQLLSAAEERLKGYSGKVSTKLEFGHPAERVLALAGEWPADVIVIGSRGLSGIAEFFLGSVSSTVAQYAKIPVLIVKEEEEEKKA